MSGVIRSQEVLAQVSTLLKEKGRYVTLFQKDFEDTSIYIALLGQQIDGEEKQIVHGAADTLNGAMSKLWKEYLNRPEDGVTP
jgi:hypothetical protein